MPSNTEKEKIAKSCTSMYTPVAIFSFSYYMSIIRKFFGIEDEEPNTEKRGNCSVTYVYVRACRNSPFFLLSDL